MDDEQSRIGNGSEVVAREEGTSSRKMAYPARKSLAVTVYVLCLLALFGKPPILTGHNYLTTHF